MNLPTFSVSSHYVEPSEFARKRWIHLHSQSQVGKGCCGNQRYLDNKTQNLKGRFTSNHTFLLLHVVLCVNPDTTMFISGSVKGIRFSHRNNLDG